MPTSMRSFISAVRGSRCTISPVLLTDVSTTSHCACDSSVVMHSGLHRPRSLPVLTGSAAEVRQPTEAVGTELFYRRALRKGDWKAVFLPKTGSAYPREGFGTGVWQLFNLARDPAEAHDLSASEPAKLQELIGDWDSYASAKNVVIPAPAPAQDGATQ